MFDPQIPAIPTIYKGITFRSRLEARWAFMFDRLQWPYEYEPRELKNYIPDFILQFHEPVLAEVKPANTLKECEQHVAKIAASTWTGDALIFGGVLKLSQASFMGPACCFYGQQFGPGGERAWGEGEMFLCGKCGKVSIYHTSLSYRCLVSGCYDGGSYIDPVDFNEIHEHWIEAGEAVRYVQGGAK
jgi:hypothetical protein